MPAQQQCAVCQAAATAETALTYLLKCMHRVCTVCYANYVKEPQAFVLLCRFCDLQIVDPHAMFEVPSREEISNSKVCQSEPCQSVSHIGFKPRATHACKTCSQLICSLCHDYHFKIHHQPHDVEKLSERMRTLCSVHEGEALIKKCSCGNFICAMCETSEAHSGPQHCHKETIDALYLGLRPKAERLRQNAALKLQDYERLRAVIDETGIHLDKERVRVIKELGATVEEVVKQLTAKCYEAIDSLNTSVKTRCDTLVKIRTELMVNRSRFSTTECLLKDTLQSDPIMQINTIQFCDYATQLAEAELRVMEDKIQNYPKDVKITYSMANTLKAVEEFAKVEMVPPSDFARCLSQSRVSHMQQAYAQQQHRQQQMLGQPGPSFHPGIQVRGTAPLFGMNAIRGLTPQNIRPMHPNMMIPQTHRPLGPHAMMMGQQMHHPAARHHQPNMMRPGPSHAVGPSNMPGPSNLPGSSNAQQVAGLGGLMPQLLAAQLQQHQRQQRPPQPAPRPLQPTVNHLNTDFLQQIARSPELFQQFTRNPELIQQLLRCMPQTSNASRPMNPNDLPNTEAAALMFNQNAPSTSRGIRRPHPPDSSVRLQQAYTEADRMIVNREALAVPPNLNEPAAKKPRPSNPSMPSADGNNGLPSRAYHNRPQSRVGNHRHDIRIAPVPTNFPQPRPESRATVINRSLQIARSDGNGTLATMTVGELSSTGITAEIMGSGREIDLAALLGPRGDADLSDNGLMRSPETPEAREISQAPEIPITIGEVDSNGQVQVFANPLFTPKQTQLTAVLEKKQQSAVARYPYQVLVESVTLTVPAESEQQLHIVEVEDGFPRSEPEPSAAKVDHNANIAQSPVGPKPVEAEQQIATDSNGLALPVRPPSAGKVIKSAQPNMVVRNPIVVVPSEMRKVGQPPLSRTVFPPRVPEPAKRPLAIASHKPSAITTPGPSKKAEEEQPNCSKSLDISNPGSVESACSEQAVGSISRKKKRRSIGGEWSIKPGSSDATTSNGPSLVVRLWRNESSTDTPPPALSTTPRATTDHEDSSDEDAQGSNRIANASQNKEKKNDRTAESWEDYCYVCGEGTEEGNDYDALGCCDSCPRVFHGYCHLPRITQKFTDLPDDWRCNFCQDVKEYKFTHLGTMNHRAKMLCGRIVLELFAERERATEFLHPVKMDGYKDVIKTPISLIEIMNRLTEPYYQNVKMFIDDLNLLFQNCSQFNPPDSLVLKSGKELYELYVKAVKKWLPSSTRFVWVYIQLYGSSSSASTK
ncbi:hypothetical protein L596_003725 [Steinernema carpocapsae]|uniref:E3 ubiquitin-protein ligase TRIM33 n=1 Tax=Steinernema carpocapsae TaxID=34508 RepID=A0A4U8UUJ2_STECR|nr:hypothetical protein L596_003725 [Steinernema carpocapsae]